MKWYDYLSPGYYFDSTEQSAFFKGLLVGAFAGPFLWAFIKTAFW